MDTCMWSYVDDRVFEKQNNEMRSKRWVIKNKIIFENENFHDWMKVCLMVVRKGWYQKICSMMNVVWKQNNEKRLKDGSLKSRIIWEDE